MLFGDMTDARFDIVTEALARDKVRGLRRRVTGLQKFKKIVRVLGRMDIAPTVAFKRYGNGCDV